MRGRVIGILTVMLLAPITAELLQAYLGDLGGPGGLIFVILFFAPMYGGAALLIREVTVRTGRGWRGRLLLATAFGIAMPTVIDLSLFTPARDDIDDWGAILGAASWAGIGWFAVLTWVLGHVLMSVAAPIVVAESLARRPVPWLGPIGLGIVSIGFVAFATFIHRDQAASNPTTAGTGEYLASAAIIMVPIVLAFTPLGRPVHVDRSTRVPHPAACVALGVVGMTAFDLLPMSWPGVVIGAGLVGGAGWLLLRWSRSSRWSQRHLAGLTFGAVLARTAIGFLAPLPQDTTWGEKLGQNLTYLALVLALGVALARRTRTEVYSGGATGGSPVSGPSGAAASSED